MPHPSLTRDLPREIDGERWLFSLPPSSPRRPLHASIRSSVLKEIEREIEGKVALLGGDGLLCSAREEKDARRPEGVRPGYEFTDSVERGLLFARGCGGFRQKPHAYLSLSPSLSVLDFQRSLPTPPPARLRNGNCVCEERGGGEGLACFTIQRRKCEKLLLGQLYFNQFKGCSGLNGN